MRRRREKSGFLYDSNTGAAGELSAPQAAVAESPMAMVTSLIVVTVEAVTKGAERYRNVTKRGLGNTDA